MSIVTQHNGNSTDMILDNKVFFLFTLVAKRRLAFLKKEGFDRFGRNLLFAPLMKWEFFKERVEKIKDRAKAYEDAYNGIQASVERQDSIRVVIQALPQAAKIKVDKEIERLEKARRSAISEKGAYVAVSFG